MSLTSLAGTTVTGLEKCDGEDVLYARTLLFGVPCHVWLIRVEEKDGEQVATNDPHHRLDDIFALDPDQQSFCTIEVPDFPGEYVFYLLPCGA